MDRELRILMLEDVAADAEMAEHELRNGGITFQSKRVETKGPFIKELNDFSPDLILSDYTLPHFDGLSALTIAKAQCTDVPFILVSGAIGEELAITLLKTGATDYVLKSNLKRLVPAVNRALREAKERVERKQADEALKENEEQYRLLFDGITDAVYVHKVSVEKPGKFIAVNDRACSMLGYTREELLQMEVKDIDIPEQSDKIPFILEKLFRDGTSIFETCHIAKDGRKIPVEINFRLFELKGKQMVLSVVRDITERKLAEAALREHEQMISTIVESSQDWIWAIDRSGRHTYSNRAVESILGYSPAEFQGMGLDLIHPEDKRLVEAAWPGWVEERRGWRNKVMRWRAKDGAYRHLESTAMPILGPRGELLGFRGVDRDITERKRAEEALWHSHELLRAILDNIPARVFWKDMDLSFLGCNLAFARDAGFEKPDDLVGKDDFAMGWREQAESYRRDDRQVIEDGTPRLLIEEPQRTPSGETIYLLTSKVPLRDAQGAVIGVLGTYMDITERKQLEEKLQYLAYYDTLTGLPNRNLFLERINEEIARAKNSPGSLAVVITDINKFKSIFDLYGSEAGDRVLKEVAERLSAAVRKGDTVAHCGNDEFGILLINIANYGDIIMLEKIIKDISYPLNIHGDEIPLTFSTGISLYPHGGKNASELLKSAGLALSIAKKEGRNSSQFYAEDMIVTATELMALEKQLTQAIKDEEFILYYQPYWDITTKKMVGMEALIRWQSADNGLVPPGKFIPVLEDTGMIIEVGEWILREAMRQVKEWQNNGYPVVPISVNMSLVQFRQKDLAEMVKKIMGDCGFYPSLLTLEITESAFMQDIEFTRSVLTAMKEIGCSVSIDDFGTGYSSLSYLKRFPIDNLKIDISFIREMVKDPDSASIVMAIINMAHTLNLKTIAEGIETEEQWNFLRLLRCDMGQGFYLSKPLPAKDFEKLFHVHTQDK